jgi:NAD(P)-dependent dehydrogenase (short-subunit alcohol dehydrogenase family)
MLTGKRILITGATGVIGRTTAQLACEQHGSVFLVDLEGDGLSRLAATLPAGQVAWLAADVTDAAQVRQAFAAAEARFGAIDGAVLAAGIEGPVGLIEDCADDAFDAVIAVNVRGVWLSLKRCLALMKPRGTGSVVMLSSISGVGGAPRLAPYAMSKHAVLGLMRTAAREAAASGVRVNAVCPGPVESDMMSRINASLNSRSSDEPAGRCDPAASLPMGRYALPEEVAQMIVFLCSNASSYCSGGTYMVDGGYSAR